LSEGTGWRFEYFNLIRDVGPGTRSRILWVGE